MTTPPHPPMLTDYSPLETPLATVQAMRRDVWRLAGELNHVANELTRLSLWLDLLADDLTQTDEAAMQSAAPPDPTPPTY